jgi:hypothetical protein
LGTNDAFLLESEEEEDSSQYGVAFVLFFLFFGDILPRHSSSSEEHPVYFQPAFCFSLRFDLETVVLALHLLLLLLLAAAAGASVMALVFVSENPLWCLVGTFIVRTMGIGRLQLEVEDSSELFRSVIAVGLAANFLFGMDIMLDDDDDDDEVEEEECCLFASSL